MGKVYIVELYIHIRDMYNFYYCFSLHFSFLILSNYLFYSEENYICINAIHPGLVINKLLFPKDVCISDVLFAFRGKDVTYFIYNFYIHICKHFTL